MARLNTRAFTPRDREKLIDAIGKGRVYVDAQGRAWRRTGGSLVVGNPNGKVPVAQRHMDQLVADRVAYLDGDIYRLVPPRAETLAELLPDPAAVCAYCHEDKGWCELAGGVNPCEGYGEHIQDLADALDAPAVRAPFRVRGAA